MATELDMMQEPVFQRSRNWHANLVSKVDDTLLDMAGKDLLAQIEADDDAREVWKKGAERGLKTLTKDGGVAEGDEGRRDRGMDNLKHPVLNAASVLFNSRVMNQMVDRKGPIAVAIREDAEKQLQDQADRVEKFVNYAVMEETEYENVIDRVMMNLPLTGHEFVYWSWDTAKNRPACKRVSPFDIVVDPNATSLKDASRLAYKFEMTLNQYNALVESGQYAELDFTRDGSQSAGQFPGRKLIAETSGVDRKQDRTIANDEIVSLMQVHANYGFEGLDGMKNEEDNKAKVVPPYVITIVENTGQIVSIRRNWEEMDDAMTPIQHFVAYRFWQVDGFWGLGLAHVLDGFLTGATGAVRILMDNALMQSAGGGFINKSALSGLGGEVDVEAGKWTTVSFTGENIRDFILPHNFGQIPTGMFEMLQYFVDTIKHVVDATDINAGDINPNAPVGTTQMVMERADQRMKAIYQRLWRSQDEEWKILFRLYRDNLEGRAMFENEGEQNVVYAQDFASIALYPKADPTTASRAEKAAKLQTLVGLREQFPGMLDDEGILKMALSSLDIDESLLAEEGSVLSYSQLKENEMILQGEPVKASITDPDDQHIRIMLTAYSNPTYATQLQMTEQLPAFISHLNEHIANRTRKIVVMMIRQTTGQEIPLEIFDNPELNPELKQQLDFMVANVMMQSGEALRLAELENAFEDPVVKHTRELQELEKQGQAIKNEGERQKFEVELQRKRLENEALIAKQITQGNLSESANAEKIQQMQIENRLAVEKAVDDANARNAEHVQKLQQDWEAHRMEMQAEKEKLELELKGLKERNLIQRIRNTD